MFTVTEWMIFGIGLLLLLAWLFFYFRGRGQASLFGALEEKEYPLKEIYFVGYAVLETIGYGYKSKGDRKLRKEVSVLYGEKYADYYLRVIYAQKITLSFTLLTAAFAVYGLVADLSVMMVLVLFAGLAYYYYGTLTEKRITERSEEMLSDFSEVVSKLALLTNAGMIMREAWEAVAVTGETQLYKEMQRTVNEMNNGAAEIDAFFDFGLRCLIPEIKKFASTIVQGLVKGNSELTVMLQQQSREVWALKKQSVRRQGERAASKLMLPMMIMFLGILIMILVPIFTNIGA